MFEAGLRELLQITKFDHIAIVVRKIDDILPVLQKSGWKVSSPRFTHAEAGRTLLNLSHPNYAVRLEVLEPAGENSYLVRFLAKHGPGQHHLTFYVRDLRRARQVLEGMAVRLHEDRPHEIIIHPESGGTMIQLFPHRAWWRIFLWRVRWWRHRFFRGARKLVRITPKVFPSLSALIWSGARRTTPIHRSHAPQLFTTQKASFRRPFTTQAHLSIISIQPLLPLLLIYP